MAMQKLRYKSQGYSLLEVAIVVSVILVLLILLLNYFSRINKDEEAIFLGQKYAQYSLAVKNRLITDKTLEDGIYSGKGALIFLKDATCIDGGKTADNYYLPCNFSFDDVVINSNIDLSVEINANSDGRGGRTAKIKFGPVERLVGGQYQIDRVFLAEALRVARAYYGSLDSGRLTQGITSYSLGSQDDKLDGYLITDIATPYTQDVWLESDGNNEMRGNVTFDENTKNSELGIKNVENINFTNTKHSILSTPTFNINVKDAKDSTKQGELDVSALNYNNKAQNIEYGKIGKTKELKMSAKDINLNSDKNIDEEDDDTVQATDNIKDYGKIHLGADNPEDGSNVYTNDLYIDGVSKKVTLKNLLRNTYIVDIESYTLGEESGIYRYNFKKGAGTKMCLQGYNAIRDNVVIKRILRGKKTDVSLGRNVYHKQNGKDILVSTGKLGFGGAYMWVTPTKFSFSNDDTGITFPKNSGTVEMTTISYCIKR